jgi:hypothetical protein
MAARPMVVLLAPVVLFCSVVERPEYLRLVDHLRTRLDPWGVHLDLARDHPQADRSIETKWKSLIDQSSGMIQIWSEQSHASSPVLREYAHARAAGKKVFLLRVQDWRRRVPVLPIDWGDREWYPLDGASPSSGDWFIDEAAFQRTIRRIYDFAAEFRG